MQVLSVNKILALARRVQLIQRARRFYPSAYNAVNQYFQNCALKLFLFTEWGSTKTGEQDGLIGTAMNCVLHVPKFLPQEQRFDIRVLVSSCICYISIRCFAAWLCL